MSADLRAKLAQLKELHEVGLLTDADFQKQKDALLATAMGTTPAATPPVLSGATHLESGPGATNADPLAGKTTVDPSSGLPATLGNYRVLGLIGAGGMGTVVRARHAEEGWAKRQGGDVAIKLIHPHISADSSFRERFFDEAGLGRRVQHPGLARVYDVVSEGPWLGTILEYIEGEELTEWVKPGGLPVDEVVALLTPLAEAVDVLHSQGIVHRDLKPANVKVRPDGQPVLLDLGIAKDLSGESGGQTKTMTSMGTSAWMAPEQADAKAATAAADVYAFGLMVYALLSGRMPWDDSESAMRVVTNKMTGKLTPLSTVAPQVPEAVAQAVMGALAVEPPARPASCSALMTALMTALMAALDGHQSASAAAADNAAREAERRAEDARRQAEQAAEESRRQAEEAQRAAERKAKESRRQAEEAQRAAERKAKEAKAAKKRAATKPPVPPVSNDEDTPLPTTRKPPSKAGLGCLALLALPICWVGFWVWTATSQRGHYEVLCSGPREAGPGDLPEYSNFRVAFDVSGGAVDVGLAVNGMSFLNDVSVSGLQIDIDGVAVQSAKVVGNMSDLAPHFWCCSRFEVTTPSGTVWIDIEPEDDNDQPMCTVLTDREGHFGRDFKGRFLQRP